MAYYKRNNNFYTKFSLPTLLKNLTKLLEKIRINFICTLCFLYFLVGLHCPIRRGQPKS